MQAAGTTSLCSSMGHAVTCSFGVSSSPCVGDSPPGDKEVAFCPGMGKDGCCATLFCCPQSCLEQAHGAGLYARRFPPGMGALSLCTPLLLPHLPGGGGPAVENQAAVALPSPPSPQLSSGAAAPGTSQPALRSGGGEGGFPYGAPAREQHRWGLQTPQSSPQRWPLLALPLCPQASSALADSASCYGNG